MQWCDFGLIKRLEIFICVLEIQSTFPFYFQVAEESFKGRWLSWENQFQVHREHWAQEGKTLINPSILGFFRTDGGLKNLVKKGLHYRVIIIFIFMCLSSCFNEEDMQKHIWYCEKKTILNKSNSPFLSITTQEQLQ